MVSPDPFLPAIEKFLSETGISASGFGKAALGDPMFVRDLRLTGRKIKPKTRRELEAFMAKARKAARAA
jgi:hypothetical protein